MSYEKIIERVIFDRHRPGEVEVGFVRGDLADAAEKFGVSAYSLQNHLRTTVPGIGQIEVDEIYVAVDSTGRQFILPANSTRRH